MPGIKGRLRGPYSKLTPKKIVRFSARITIGTRREMDFIKKFNTGWTMTDSDCLEKAVNDLYVKYKKLEKQKP